MEAICQNPQQRIDLTTANQQPTQRALSNHSRHMMHHDIPVQVKPLTSSKFFGTCWCKLLTYQTSSSSYFFDVNEMLLSHKPQGSFNTVKLELMYIIMKFGLVLSCRKSNSIRTGIFDWLKNFYSQVLRFVPGKYNNALRNAFFVSYFHLSCGIHTENVFQVGLGAFPRSLV